MIGTVVELFGLKVETVVGILVGTVVGILGGKMVGTVVKKLFELSVLGSERMLEQWSVQ